MPSSMAAQAEKDVEAGAGGAGVAAAEDVDLVTADSLQHQPQVEGREQPDVDEAEDDGDLQLRTAAEPSRTRRIAVAVTALLAVTTLIVFAIFVIGSVSAANKMQLPERFRASYRVHGTGDAESTQLSSNFTAWGRLAKLNGDDGIWKLYSTNTFRLADGRAVTMTLNEKNLLYSIELPKGTAEKNLNVTVDTSNGGPTAAAAAGLVAQQQVPVLHKCMAASQASSFGNISVAFQDLVESATPVDVPSYPDERVREQCSNADQVWAGMSNEYTFIICLELASDHAVVIGPDFIVDIVDIQSASLPADSDAWWNDVAPMPVDHATDKPKECNNVPDLTDADIVGERRVLHPHTSSCVNQQCYWFIVWICECLDESDYPPQDTYDATEETDDDEQDYRRRLEEDLEVELASQEVANPVAVLDEELLKRELFWWPVQKHPLCVFMHGSGVTHDSYTSSSDVAYWGNVHLYVASYCSSVRFLRRNTVDRPWTDTSNVNAFCDVAAGGHSGHTIKSGTVIFTHEMGNLIVGRALQTGACRWNPSARWHEAQSATHQLVDSDFSYFFCMQYRPATASDTAIALQRDTHMCTLLWGEYHRPSPAMVSMGRGYRSLLQSVVPYINVYITGSMCGSGVEGLSNSFYPSVLPTRWQRPMNWATYEVAWSKCWSNVASFSPKYSSAYYEASYLNNLDVTCRNGNMAWDFFGVGSPCSWYRSRVAA